MTQNNKDPLFKKKALLALSLPSRFSQSIRGISSWLHHIKAITQHFIARLLQCIALFVVIGIPLILLGTGTYGLGDKLLKRFEAAISGQFYDVKIHRLLFTINEGLIAENLELLEKTPQHRLLVHAKRVTILPKFSSLARGHLDIDSFQLRHTTIDVPLSTQEEPRLRLDHVGATIISSPGQLNLTNASFKICGIKVRVHGNFLNPKTFLPGPVSDNGPGKVAQMIVRIQQELQKISWEGASPTLEMEVSGDLTHTESLRADSITFHSEGLNYQRWHPKNLTADFSYANFILKLQQLSVEDSLGELHASGMLDFKALHAMCDFSGSCDLVSWAALAFPKIPLSDWKAIDPPHLEGSCSVDWQQGTPVVNAKAQAEMGRFLYGGVAFDHLSGGCIFQENKFLLRDFQLSGAPGSLAADLMLAPNDYRVRINAEILPQLMIPALKGGVRTAFSLMNFKDPLKVSFEGQAPVLTPFSFDGTGTLALGRSSMRGAWIDSCAANFTLHDGALDFKNVTASIGKEHGEGAFVYDFKNWEARFSKITSLLDPVTVMMWIDPRIAQSLKDYRFRRSPEAKVTGIIGLRDPEKNDFSIEIAAPSGLDYTLIKRDLFFNAVAGIVKIKRQALLVDIPYAKLLEGDASIKANVSIVPDDGHYSANVHVNNIDFKSITKLYFDYDTSQGKLSGDYNFTALSNNERAMKGKGSLLIKDGNVYDMPIFGPISLLMNDIIPGLGYQAARRAVADFTVENGIINTKKLSIESDEFSMIGAGDIYYLDDRMNMSVRLNVKGLPGLVLFPVSKLFEYVSDGSFKNASWRAKYVPRIPHAGGATSTPTPTPIP